MALTGVGRAVATSSVLHVISDTVAQTVEQWDRPERAYDLKRVGMFGIVGACLHGPYFHQAFRLLDRYFGMARNVQTVVVKSVVGQGTAAPLYLALFYGATTALRGGTLEDYERRMKDHYVQSTIASAMVWLPANLVNFSVIPTQHRILFINVVGLGWQSYLSWMANRRHIGEATVSPLAD